MLWAAPVWARHLAAPLMLVALVLLAASQVPRNHVKAALHHPMLLSVKVWALAHLLANNTLADLVLFGSFLIWAVLDFRSARRRDRVHGTAYPPGTAKGTAITIVAGIDGVGALRLLGPRSAVRGAPHRLTRTQVRITEMCSVPLSGSHTSPGRPRICRMFAPRAGSEALELLAAGIEAQHRVGAEIADPHLVPLIDIHRIAARPVPGSFHAFHAARRPRPGSCIDSWPLFHSLTQMRPRLSLQTRRAPWPWWAARRSATRRSCGRCAR